MKKIILILVFYGLFYYFFESLFNYLTITLRDKKLTLKQKLQTRTTVSCSFWMIPVGAKIGLILYCLFLINWNMFNIWIILLVCLIGGIIITAIELGSGLLLNKVFKLDIWDYSHMKFNLWGQIEPFHSIGWFGITYLFYFVNQLLK